MQSHQCDVIPLKSRIHPFRCFLDSISAVSSIEKNDEICRSLEDWTLYLCQAVPSIGISALDALSDLHARAPTMANLIANNLLHVSTCTMDMNVCERQLRLLTELLESSHFDASSFDWDAMVSCCAEIITPYMSLSDQSSFKSNGEQMAAIVRLLIAGSRFHSALQSLLDEFISCLLQSGVALAPKLLWTICQAIEVASIVDRDMIRALTFQLLASTNLKAKAAVCRLLATIYGNGSYGDDFISLNLIKSAFEAVRLWLKHSADAAQGEIDPSLAEKYLSIIANSVDDVMGK